MPETVEQPPYSRWYLRYALGLLVVVYAFNFIDRQILVILQEPIKKEMGLSDGQLGMLSGFTFAIFYATLGIPIARLADRGNRRNIIAWSVSLWSVMTALSGWALNFGQLLAARIGVGVGEAGGSPPAHAIISDYFPPRERARALSIYSTGIYVGVLFGGMAGGWLTQHFGWRAAFFAVGLPGLLVALLVRLTIREPRRGHSEGTTHEEAPVPLREAIRSLWNLRSFRYLALGAGFNTFVNYGTGNFLASFLIRTHHLPLGQVGAIGGLVNGVGGMVGTFLGGVLATKLGRNDLRRYLWVPIGGLLVGLAIRLIAYWAPTPGVAVAFLAPADLMAALYLGPCIAVAHALVRPGLRSFVSAVLFFVLNLIGLGGGPIFTGMVSDLLLPRFGEQSLRWALSITTLSWIPAIGLFLLAVRTLKADLARPGGSPGDPR